MKKEQADRIIETVVKQLKSAPVSIRVINFNSGEVNSDRFLTEALRTALEAVELTSEREVLIDFAKSVNEGEGVIYIHHGQIDRYLKQKGETK